MNFDNFAQNSLYASTHCPTVYELYFKLESESTYTLWDSSISNFISSFDVDSSVGTQQVKIYTTDAQGAAKYNIKVIGKVDPTVLGVDSQEI